MGTLLLLHAFPLNARMWESQLTSCAGQGWRAVAPHWRGLQRQEEVDDSFDGMAGSVADLLKALQIDAPVVCGVSMGGYLAFSLVRRLPHAIRALVLCDTRAEADTPQGREGRVRMLAMLQDRGVAAVADEMMPRLLGETTRRTNPALIVQVRALALANRAAGIAGVITAMMTRDDSTPMLPAIACPTLILAGDEDVITPPAISEAMHRAIAGSQLVVLEGVGHLPSLEQPRRFADALSPFLAGLR